MRIFINNDWKRLEKPPTKLFHGVTSSQLFPSIIGSTPIITTLTYIESQLTHRS